MLAEIVAAYNATLAMVSRIWTRVEENPRIQLEKQRAMLVTASRQALIDGDLLELRRIRGQIEHTDIELDKLRSK